MFCGVTGFIGTMGWSLAVVGVAFAAAAFFTTDAVGRIGDGATGVVAFLTGGGTTAGNGLATLTAVLFTTGAFTFLGAGIDATGAIFATGLVAILGAFLDLATGRRATGVLIGAIVALGAVEAFTDANLAGTIGKGVATGATAETFTLAAVTFAVAALGPALATTGLAGAAL